MSQPISDEEYRARIRELEDQEDGFLPPAGDREWIVERFAELVAAAGGAHLLVAPLVDASETYFPDPWRGGEPSLVRLLRRLFIYAGEPDANVEVSIAESAPTGKVASGPSISPVVFEGRRQGVFHFAADALALRNPSVLVPAAARAVTEAWRVMKGLPLRDDANGQRTVDVTTIYLGFGRMTVNAAIQDHVGSSLGMSASRSRSRLGLLSPTHMAFALSVMAVARELSDKECKRLAKALAPNPSAFFKAGLASLRLRQPPLSQVLGIPSRSAWPEAPDLELLTAPLEDEGEHEDEVRAEEEARKDIDRGVVGMNEGKPVFRVVRSKAMRLAKMFALPVAGVGMLAARVDLGIELPMWQVGLVAAGLGLSGLVVGRFLEDSRCSEPTCGADLTGDDTVCPRCGGTVRGVIGHAKERLAAEEALEREPQP